MSTLVVLSGGMDSTAALALAASEDTVVEAITFDYRQRHRREIEAAEEVAAEFDVRWNLVKVPLDTLSPDSALTGGQEVPHGHYAADNMAITVVPNRNMVFTALAVSRAMTLGADTVMLGVHAGDHAVYADCRSEFIAAMKYATILASDETVQIAAPFVDISKADIARRGWELGAPFHLTWSCYEGGDMHCGRCGTCVERAEAFAEAGNGDPTTYADPDFWKEMTS